MSVKLKKNTTNITSSGINAIYNSIENNNSENNTAATNTTTTNNEEATNPEPAEPVNKTQEAGEIIKPGNKKERNPRKKSL